MPAPFRAVLAGAGFEGVFLHPALDAPALDGGGQPLIDEIQALLDSRPLYSPEREDLATALFGEAEIVRFDSEGRMMLSPRLRAASGLEEAAVFVGQGRKFQIWEPNAFARRLEASRLRARALRGGPGVPEPGARE